MAEPEEGRHDPLEGRTQTEGPRAVWDRLDGESETAFAYFVTYRNLGRRRTVVETAAYEEVQPTTLWAYSSDFNWRERARAWDAWNDQLFEAGMVDARQRISQQHVEVGELMMEIVRKKLKWEGDFDNPSIGWGDIAKLADVATMTARRGAGLEQPGRPGVTFAGPVQINDNRQVNVIEEVNNYAADLLKFSMEHPEFAQEQAMLELEAGQYADLEVGQYTELDPADGSQNGSSNGHPAA